MGLQKNLRIHFLDAEYKKRVTQPMTVMDSIVFYQKAKVKGWTVVKVEKLAHGPIALGGRK